MIVQHNSTYTATYGDVGVCVGTRGVANQHRVTLAVVARPHRGRLHLHQPPIRVAAAPGRDALADDAAARVFTDVDHLGAGVGLLAVVGEGNGVKFSHAVVALEDDRWVFPRDG